MKSKMVLCALALVVTSGCETPGKSMQFAGAAAGAALGGYVGAQFGGGLGMWAYSASGTIIGGMAGYEAGRVLSESDMVFYRGTAEQALADADNGVTLNWQNPKTGNSGAFRPTQTVQTINGQTCRHFRSTVAFKDAVESGDGTACRQSDGRWQIVSNYFG